MRTLLSVAAAFTLALPSLAQTPELRGTWVARDGLTSRAKIISTLDALQAANCNLVCVDVWTRGYTIHPSDVLFAACGVRQDPDPAYVGRDPLAEFVFEAHRRGIEVEAWFEYGFMFGWSGWYAGPTGVGPVLTANPSWIARDNTGNSQVGTGVGGYWTWAIHEHPAVRQFLIDLCVEVANKYDVDGIQLDRVRYPSTSFGYDATTSAAYQAATGNPPPTNVNNAAWMRWRADGLNAFHLTLYNAIKAVRSTLRVSDAPTSWPGAYNNFMQDWPQWVIAGSIDLVYPQLYTTTASSFTNSLNVQLNTLPLALRSRVAPGIRTSSGTSTTEVLGMVAADRARNLPGHVFWYAEDLYDDLPALTTNYFQTAAPMPLRPANWRPPSVEREENDPSTTSTAGFTTLPLPAASGGQVRLSQGAATASDKVTYTFPVSETGLWSVIAYVPSLFGMSATAPHTIAHAGGTAVLAIDESQAATTGWRELGTFWFTQGTATLEVNALPGQSVLADRYGLLRSRLPSGPMLAVGFGTAGALGGLRSSMHGRAGLGGTVVVQGNRMPPGMPVVLGLALQGTSIPLFGGTLYVLPLATFGGFANAVGAFATTVTLPVTPSLLGATLWAQGLALDAAGQDGVSLSAAATTTVQ